MGRYSGEFERGHHFDKAGALFAAGALTLSACSVSVETGTAEPTPSSEQQPSVLIVPNFSHLNKAGTCQGGDARPCFLPLRTVPDVNVPATANNIVNVTDGTSHVSWPYESANGNPGDPVEVVCQVYGNTIVKDTNDNGSRIYDVIKVPREHASTRALQAAAQPGVNYGVEKNTMGDVTEVYAFAPELWLQDGDTTHLQHCTSAENPASYEEPGR